MLAFNSFRSHCYCIALDAIRHHSRKNKTLPDIPVKKPKKIRRNPHAISAKKRRAGKMRSKKDKRSNNKNEQLELLKEAEDK